MSDLTPFETRSKNVTKINNAKKDLPFCTRYYNRPSVDTVIDSGTCTDRSHKEDTDLNVIVAKHSLLGVPLPTIDGAIYNINADDVQVGETYGTVTNITERLLLAKQNFMSLPSSLRAKFDNDVAIFADYLNTSSDDDVNSMLKQFGLRKEEVIPAVGNQDLKDPIPPTDNVQESVSP